MRVRVNNHQHQLVTATERPRCAILTTAATRRASRRSVRRGELFVVKAQGEDQTRSTSDPSKDGEGKGPKTKRGGRKRRNDPVLRRRKKEEDKQIASSISSEPDGQLDAVNPISLGRRARKNVDTAWRRFTRLGQPLASTSIADYEAERSVDLVQMETTGFEVPQAIDTRVLVVGATGQIGRVVLTKLLLRGYTVRAMVQNLSDELLDNIPPSVELIKGDISDLNDCFEAARDCDKVICCSKARTNLMADITRVENTGVRNLVTAMLHHNNPSNKPTAKKNKIVLFKFQNHKNSNKWGSWSIEGQGENYSDFGYLGQAALPKVEVQMPTEENENLLFEGSNTDFAETVSPISLSDDISLKECEGLVVNVAGVGKKFAVVLYSEDESGRHGYVSEFSTSDTGYCTRRIPFTAFTRLNADQPPLNLNNVKDFGFRYRSAWNKSASLNEEEAFVGKNRNKDPRSFRLKLDWVKALPSGPESDVILVSCSGQMYGDEDKERYLKPKRAGEAHLRNSGLGYTIVRPSTLVDVPGGQKALVFDQGSRLKASISSADVADVCIRCLHATEARNKTFEVSNESDESVSDFELVAHIPDKTDYVTAAVHGLEKNT